MIPVNGTNGSHVCCSSFSLFGVRDVQDLRLYVFNSVTSSLPPSECRLTGMPKEKYDSPDPRRLYTIMSAEEVANGKKSHWAELEISGRVRTLSSSLWTLTHLTALHINDNNLSRIPPDIGKLPHLIYLNLSSNKLRSLPAELGNMVCLRELLLNNNLLRVLPYELGRLFQLQTLGLKGNPLSQDILNLYQESDGTRKLLNYMLDNLAVHPEQLPQRPWITLKERDPMIPTAMFTVMCYNVLCDKYATRQLYGYCPSWALNWEYRKKGIMEEITHCDADIISLQEVETEQYHALFLETLKERGYDGYFCPKSRAKLVSEQERKHVDGCAVFFKTEKFTLVQKHTVEFNQVAMANSEGSEVMLNRVMTKDNIGVAVLLEVNKDMFSGGLKPLQEKQLILVANAHMHWDPEFCDVKLIQTMMFLSELKSITERHLSSVGTGSPTSNPAPIPIVLCADLNSLPDSGVVEYLSNGGVAENHKDFRELRYNEALTNFSCQGNGSITHSFQLKSAYQDSLMSYTNYTYDFKGIIDYIFFSKTHMSVAGLLGPLESQWLTDNNITGCPHPHIPSDHFSLLAQLELHSPLTTTSSSSSSLNGLHLPVHR
ncbi:CCR4-NOT transcription complex subunit 6-like isoform X1 [Salmo salar]|uniref:poly(A)-specific ribonuclease n=1 Tax=Salmo salar TaxID=8030 RepID=A0A1S3PK80_SALSA|nr:CCR4-NOT transcription complex subunit 6-like isoform X1 [Salmo salar]|eukprot:XP_014028065.1 PREDICTED: CCR4-NOT transcription complex subunit 6-like isoform X1 [Salmo salar]